MINIFEKFSEKLNFGFSPIYSFFKQKKMFLFLFFSVFVFLTIPKITHAIFGVGALIDFVIMMAILIGPLIARFIFASFAQISSALITYVINIVSYWPITKDPIFLKSWVIVRDWANMLIVLGLIGIAIATILRFKDYEAKKLLVPLIIVALLVNFSIVFVGLMIDVSNIIVNDLLIKSGSPATNVINNINRESVRITGELDRLFLKAGKYGLDSALPAGGWPKLLNETARVAIAILLMAFAYAITGLIFIYMAFLLIARYAILAILFILSPLAFVFKVFPIEASKKLWSEWWQLFLKWCFIGVGLSFSLYLASQMLGGSLSEANNSGNIFNIIKNLAVASIIMFVGIKMSIRSGTLGASTVMGLATGLTAGVALGTLKGIGKVTGVSGTAQRVKNFATDKATRIAEATPILRNWVPKGTANLRQQARLQVDNNAKEIATLTPEEREKINFGSAVTENAKNKKIESIRQSLTNGESKNWTAQQNESAMKYYTYHKPGITSEEMFLKGNPDSAKYATASQDELIRTKKATGADNSEKRANAIKILTREAYVRMPEDKELLRLNNQEKIDRIVTSAGGIDPNTGKLRGNVGAKEAQLIEDMAEKGTLGTLAKVLEGFAVSVGHTVNGMQEVSKQMNGMASQLGSTGFKDAKAKDPHYAGLDSQAIEERAQNIAGVGNPILATHKTTASQELSDEAHGKISAYQMAADMDESVIDEDFVLNRQITAKKLGTAGKNERMSENKKRRLKDTLPRIAYEQNVAGTAGNAALAAGNLTLGNQLIDWANELRERWIEINTMQ